MSVLRRLARSCGLALAAWSWRFGLNVRATRQISGLLRFDPAALPAAVYPVGSFIVAWEPGNGWRLVVTHQTRPNDLAWATLPGKGFVAAARGTEWVTESRSHFFIADTLHLVCAEQRVEHISATDGMLTISGRLSARCSGASVGYTLTFVDCGTNQLGFTLTLDNSAYNRTTSATPRTRMSISLASARSSPISISRDGACRSSCRSRVSDAAPSRSDWPRTSRRRPAGAWPTSYASVPHYITNGLRSLFLTSYEYAVFDLRQADRVQIQLFASELPGRILRCYPYLSWIIPARVDKHTLIALERT